MTFGEALKTARLAAGLTQQQLGDLLGVTQGAIGHIEKGIRGVEQSPDIVERLERALSLIPGTLARHLPSDHPARRMRATEVPVLGTVAAGAGREEPAEEGEILRLAELWPGCVAYRARGESMIEYQIADGDYLIVVPVSDRTPQPEDVVVAWIDGQGYTVKRLDRHFCLRGSGRWKHKLSDADSIIGVLVGVVRRC